MLVEMRYDVTSILRVGQSLELFALNLECFTISENGNLCSGFKWYQYKCHCPEIGKFCTKVFVQMEACFLEKVIIFICHRF